MPRQSMRQGLLDQLDAASLQVAMARIEHARHDTDDFSSGSDSMSSIPSPMIISPISPISSDSETSDKSSDSSGADFYDIDLRYLRLFEEITVLRDEVERARVLHRPDEPPMRAPQIQLLPHFAVHRPDLFRQKLRVHPEVFDDILDCISDHPIFKSNSNNRQLPIALQLAIFLNRAGHYGNSIANEYVCQWAGVSVGSVTNCTNRVMIALLERHDDFIFFPSLNSTDAARAREYVSKICPQWRNGIFATDGSMINLCNKPGLYGETFFNRKSDYSLNCQVCLIFFLKHSTNICTSR